MKVLCGTHFAAAILAVVSTSPALAQAPATQPAVVVTYMWQQGNRANHFTVNEIWKNEAALDDHVVAPATREFREKLGPKNGALYDDRRYKNLE